MTAASCAVPEAEFSEPEAGGAGGEGGVSPEAPVVAEGGAAGTVPVGGAGGGGNLSGAGGAGGAGGAVALVCETDEDCASRYPSTRVCDPDTNRCVVCLPGTDTCGEGRYCGDDQKCQIGCASDADCAEGQQCDPETHQCGPCTADGDCLPGTVCDPETGTCVAGCTDEQPCPEAWNCCSGVCADLLSSDENCSECGLACDTFANASASCTNGECLFQECEEGFADCNQDLGDGCEVDLNTDPGHCGGCDEACDEGLTCSQGRCSAACEEGEGDCDDDHSDCETNLTSDRRNCGACGNVCDLTHADSSCAAGACVIDSCAAGWGDCDDDADTGCETDLTADAEHCGQCGTECSGVNGTPVCTNTICSVVCADDWGDCDGDLGTGCETSLTGSSDHCGACHRTCLEQNGSNACVAGECEPECAPGFGDCDGNPANGCEANLNTDLGHCGACATACQLDNATPACQNGVCTIAGCDESYRNCDGDPETGCESNINTDPQHCGDCEAACSENNGTPTCTEGACTVACSEGFNDCNDDPTDGCEADTQVSIAHCGECGNACPSSSGATPYCAGGVCGESICTGGMANCNGLSNDGCEVNLDSSLENCGGCGLACPAVPNATSACDAGVCTIAECSFARADCNGEYTDGCEVNTDVNLAHCGGCGFSCSLPNAEAACVKGSCEVTACVGSFADCSEAVAGCETATDTPANCGACGNTCSLAYTDVHECVSGQCRAVSCLTGYGDCDRDPTNGCETNLVGNPLHCGQCDNACTAANADGVCNGTSCDFTCNNTDRFNCNGTWADGCETNIASTANCRACGNDCGALPNVNGVTCTVDGCRVDGCDANFGDCTEEGAGCETNLRTTVEHCGACGSNCGELPHVASVSCFASNCVIDACEGEWLDCDGDSGNGCEVNTALRADHCGQCNHNCFAVNVNQASCVAGVCEVYGCDPGYEDCTAAEGCETDVTDNDAHCGECGNACQPDAARGVTAVECSGTECIVTGCSGSLADCDGIYSNGCEVNLDVNVLHCGSCTGAVCPTTGGTPECIDGTCGYSACAAPQADCDGNGTCETNLNTNKDYCGQCSVDCDSPNPVDAVASVCSAGECEVSQCAAGGYANCNLVYADGCEINTNSDPNNCGGCGIRCGDDASIVHAASFQCIGGACRVGVCQDGWGNCDGDPTDGCETDLTDNDANCGACGSTCTNPANGSASCSGTSCEYVCNSGYRNCDGGMVPGDGCETNITNDVDNCGACGSACGLPNTATHSCSASTCHVTTCVVGWGDCNGTDADGCETDVSSPAACGSCGEGCQVDHGTGQCDFSGGAYSCSIGDCDSGYEDCDNLYATGCEAYVATDPSNCGNCDVVCSYPHASGVCSASACAMGGCDTGYDDCVNGESDGCESNLGSSETHCGSCFNQCDAVHGTNNCISGACTPNCNSGWDDCDAPEEGCTRNVEDDSSNCGSCDTVCPDNEAHSSAFCDSGTCSHACDSGWGDCNNNLDSDGCETDTDSNVNHCGQCDDPCSPPAHTTASCSNGACVFTCVADWGNCDGNMLSNGCEQSLDDDPDNCGACGNECSGGGQCVNGTCAGDPCDGYCSNPVVFDTDPYVSYTASNMGTDPTCHETTSPLIAAVCGNFHEDREMWINGTLVSCDNVNFNVPEPVNGGYCFYTSSGDYAWAWFAAWEPDP